MAEPMWSILKALVVFLVYFVCVYVPDEIVSNIGHALFDYEENIVHSYRFLPLPATDYNTPRYYLIFGPILLGTLVLFVETLFKGWTLSTLFVPIFPWIISMLFAVLPTVTHIDVVHTTIVSLRLLLYAFAANKLVGLTIGKPHKINDYKTGIGTTLLLVLLKYLFVPL